MPRYPNPHKNFMPVLPLTEDLYKGLLAVYQRITTYISDFYVPGFEKSTILWPETHDDHKWICDNILPFYGVHESELVNLVYDANDDAVDAIARHDSDRRDWGFDHVPPWTPNTLNFTRVKYDSIIGDHDDHEAGCKINIPVLNMSAANVYFRESDERYYYPAPALLNVRARHEVENIHLMRDRGIPERTFFQVVFKGSFEEYQSRLPLPYGW